MRSAAFIALAVFAHVGYAHGSFPPRLPTEIPGQDALNEILVSMDRLLTPPYRIDFTTPISALLPTTLLATGYGGDGSALQIEVEQQFGRLDANKDGQVTRAELLSVAKHQLGWFHYMRHRMFSDLNRKINQQIFVSDADGAI
jgi:hypothetical protein